MVTYKVLQTGFMFGHLYDPRGKRPELTTDKPLADCPSWLERVPSASEPVARRKGKRKVKNAQAKAVTQASDGDTVETL